MLEGAKCILLLFLLVFTKAGAGTIISYILYLSVAMNRHETSLVHFEHFVFYNNTLVSASTKHGGRSGTIKQLA